MAEDIELFIKGSIIGFLIGDAVAFPYTDINNIEELHIDMIDGQHGEPLGSWQFPGCFALATIASLTEHEDVHLDDLMEKFKDIYIGGYMSPAMDCKDVGSITSEAIKNYTNGLPADRCGATICSGDNDCLLRTLPVALYFANASIDDLIERTHMVCSLTHQDIKSQVCCSAFNIMIRNLLIQASEKVFDLLFDFYKTKGMEEYSACTQELKSSSVSKTQQTNILFDTFWKAWHSYSSHESNFYETITSAISSGGDLNGNACLAGALSGTANGLNNMPARWLNRLMLSTDIMLVIQQFVDKIQHKVNKELITTS